MKNQYNLKNFAILTMAFLFIGFNSCKEESEKEEVAEVEEKEVDEVEPFFEISLAQWSLNKAIRNGNLSPMAFAKKSQELGFNAIEYVSQLYTQEIEKYGMQPVLDSLLAESNRHGVVNVLIMVDGEGDLADPSESVRNESVENHKKWVDAANFLGCHSIRVNTFGSNDPDQWYSAVVDGLTKLSEYASTKGVNVLVENHGWLSSDADKLMAAINEVNMANCGTLPDFGNWCIKRKAGERWGDCEEEYPDIYKGTEMMMTKAKAVSAKSYNFNEDGYETKLNFPKLLKIVKDAGYTGYIGIEYEGDELGEEEGIMATRDLLLKAAKEIE